MVKKLRCNAVLKIGIHLPVEPQQQHNKYDRNKCIEIKEKTELVNADVKQDLGEKRKQEQLHAPLLKIPYAHIGNKISGYKNSENCGHKCAQLFNGGRKHLRKGKHDGQIAYHAKKGYDSR